MEVSERLNWQKLVFGASLFCGFAKQAGAQVRREFPPNELGRIPVLMYHAIGAQLSRGARYDRHGLNISPETFRSQLELMYAAGWYPMNMRDTLDPHMVVPKGRIPVVITLDDARGTQFTYRKDGSIDPNCAVAILEEFHARHLDWPLKASFYVLPKSKYNPTPFYQPGTEAKKIQYLVSKGFEVANHSTSHRMMANLDRRALQWEMAECVRYFKKLDSRVTMDTMALPGGSVPRIPENMGALLDGEEGGTHYHNLCILRAWGGATFSPAHKKFDRKNILRIGSDPGIIESAIRNMKPGADEEPYVSDGDPTILTFPKRLEKFVNSSTTFGMRLVSYEDRTKKPSKDKVGETPGTGNGKIKHRARKKSSSATSN